jgi:uncharacterized membrane protein
MTAQFLETSIMTLLIAGLLIFLGIHSLSIVNEPLRDRLAERLGNVGWQALYATIAIVGFVLIVRGYSAARLEPMLLYTPPVWLRHVSLLLMVFVFPLLLAAYLPGRIQDIAKHPMLLATKVWALAHLLANGMLHDVILFGAFLAWAVADRVSLKRRQGRPVPGPARSKLNDIVAVVGGVGLYLWFLIQGHAWLFGVSSAAAG